MDQVRDRSGDDAAATAEVADRVAAMQARYAPRNRAIRRALHTKTIAAAAGYLVVSDNVPAELRAGLFARPARHAAIVRFSSGQSWERPDWVPDVRGMAVRISGLPVSAEGVQWQQDLLAVNGNIRFARDVAEFARLMPLMQSMVTVPLHVGRSIGVRQASAFGRDFAGIVARTLTCISGQSFFCVAPIAVGGSAAKIALHPRQKGRRRSRLFAPDGLGESIDAWLEDTDLAWDLTLQRYRDGRTTPLDDLGVRWSERDSPPVRVASLVLSRRDRQTARLLRTEVERLAFSPWNALAEHRPIGCIQELRGRAYDVSVAGRLGGREGESRADDRDSQ